MKTKKEILAAVHENYGLNIKKTAVEAVVGAFLAELVRNIEAGEEIRITELGVFKIQERKAKIGRNLKTGEEVPIPAHLAPKLKFNRSITAALKAK